VPDQPLEAPPPGGRRIRLPKRAPSAAEAASSVAVLDEEQPQDDLAEPPAAEEPVAEVPAEEPVAEQPERETSAPQPGTAAERAAARRARMRAQNEKGKR
jgi:hypothetical protein